MITDILTYCIPCLLNTTPTISINSTSFKLLNVLGEGSYSIVYLVQQNSRTNKRFYALKKMRTISTSSTQKALNEVSYYNQFKSPYIIKAIDSSSIQELDGSRSIYILLPYFKNGSLQDLINTTILDPEVTLSEHEILRIFIAICRGVLTLHSYHTPQQSQLYHDIIDVNNHNNDDDDDINTELSEAIPYAHYDLKPDNIFISRDGTPIIGDLGSCTPARIHITSRPQAISFQERVAENSTPEYRAPELFDVKINQSFDEKVDVWSLGCLLYAVMYGIDPFTRQINKSGANLKLAIKGNKWSIPAPDDPEYKPYTEHTINIIKSALNIDNEQRPTVDTLLQHALTAMDVLES